MKKPSKRWILVALLMVFTVVATFIVLKMTKPPEDLSLIIPGSVGVQLKMRLIPAGTFTMGSPEGDQDRLDNEGPQHPVTITKPFYMGVYEVTQEQWAAVMGSNPSYFDDNPRNPVEWVSWNDCQEFIAMLNTLGIGTFRLPTEAEWEYACRAGSTTRFPWGDDSGYSRLGEYAWYSTNSNNTTRPVGQKKPNAWGLYDMHGNVWEWCSDWYADSYSSYAQTDPQGPATGSYRVGRGGRLDLTRQYCRSADRFSLTPSFAYYFLGFRLVRASQ